MYFKKCEICDKEFKVYSGQKRTYCSVDCMKTGYSKRLTGTNNPNYRHGRKNCSKCGKELNRGTKGNFCSACLPREGENNNFFGKKHSEESLEKMSDKKSGEANPFFGRKLTEDHKKKLQVKWERKKGKENPCYGIKYSEDRIKRMVKTGKECWNNLSQDFKDKALSILKENSSKMLLSHGMTKPEKMVAEQLEQLGIKFEHNKFLYNKFFVDFLLESGTIIEVFGDYWHFNPLVFKEPSETQKKQIIKDKSRIAYLEKCGHKVIVIWEKELKDDKSDKKIVNIRLS